jgi:uncharacterized protein (DUF58 family)
MLTREQLKAVRKIQIRTSHLVAELFAGQYQSAFKGRGIEFAEVRQYFPGDDVRTIDWNVTARTGIPHVKRYVEEREVTVMILVDVSASTHFGTVRHFKQELAAEMAALFAFSAITNNDKVGLLMFSDRIEKIVRPGKGSRHVLRVIREILGCTPEGQGTSIALALEHLDRVTTRGCVVILLSDFLDQDHRRALKIASRRHDVVGVVLDDPRDMELPALGLVALQDPETGARAVVDTGDRRLRETFAAHQSAARRGRDRMLASVDVDAIAVRTDRPYVDALRRFFRTRERRRAH